MGVGYWRFPWIEAAVGVKIVEFNTADRSRYQHVAKTNISGICAVADSERSGIWRGLAETRLRHFPDKIAALGQVDEREIALGVG